MGCETVVTMSLGKFALLILGLMFIVFCFLIILWGGLYILDKLFPRDDETKNKSQEVKK